MITFSKNKSKSKNFTYILIFTISIVLLLVSLVNILIILKEYKDADNLYSQMQDYLEVETAGSSNTASDNNLPNDPTDDKVVFDDDLQSKNEELQFKIDFDRLHEINEDIIGWIYFDNDVINYPIAQADDNDFYLRRTITGEHNNAGTIFSDYKNNYDFSDYNTFLYGHNMRDGSMFAFLNKYTDIDNYQQYPSFWIVTPEGQHQYEIFSLYQTGSVSESFQISFYSEEDYASYLDHVKDLSIHDTEVEVDSSDNIITLSTCLYNDNTRRFLVHAKRINN